MTTPPSDRAQTRLGERRKLGRAELPAGPIGLGLAAVGRPAYITLGRAEDLGPDRSVEALRRLTHALLDAAYAAGVRYLDAARSYGYAEEFLSSWLAERKIASGEVTQRQEKSRGCFWKGSSLRASNSLATVKMILLHHKAPSLT